MKTENKTAKPQTFTDLIQKVEQINQTEMQNPLAAKFSQLFAEKKEAEARASKSLHIAKLFEKRMLAENTRASLSENILKKLLDRAEKFGDATVKWSDIGKAIKAWQDIKEAKP